MDLSIFTPIDNETQDNYITRIRNAFPNIPDEVILQWFFDHYQQIEEYSWIDFSKLTFNRITVLTEEIPIKNIGNDSCIEHYLYNFTTGTTRKIPRFKRISDYFEKYGTWPIPPIYLANYYGKYQFDIGFKCGIPFHLVEGHNRLAQFIYYKNKGNTLLDTHEIYLANF